MLTNIIHIRIATRHTTFLIREKTAVTTNYIYVCRLHVIRFSFLFFPHLLEFWSMAATDFSTFAFSQIRTFCILILRSACTIHKKIISYSIKPYEMLKWRNFWIQFIQKFWICNSAMRFEFLYQIISCFILQYCK